MKKRAVTLMEMLIVMLLIGIIGGVLAFNMKGSLDKGRIFKTEASMRLIEDIAQMELADAPDALSEQELKALIVRSPLAGRGEELLKDGWGEEFRLSRSGDKVEVYSKRYAEWKEKNAHAS